MLLKKYSLKELLVLLVGAVFNRILNKLNYYSKYLPLKREINYFVANGCDVFSYGRSLRIANSKRYPSLNFEIRKHTSDIFVFRQVIIKEEYSPIVELIKSKINLIDLIKGWAMLTLF